MREGTRLEDVGQDASYAWRGLRRSPGFTIAVMLVLALGLGANAALYSLLDRIFLSPPAGVAAPREIRRLYYIQPQLHIPGVGSANVVQESMDYPEYAAMRASAEGGVRYATYDMRSDSVDTRIGAAVVPAMVSYATQSYFAVLGVRPALGRFFTADEDRVDATNTGAVISDALWRRGFAGDSAVLGKHIRFGGQSYSVVGVAPRGFEGIDLDRVDLWLPLGDLPVPPFWGSPPWYVGGWHVMRVIARVPAGVTDQRVAAEATAAYRHVHQSEGFQDTTSTILTGPIVAALGPLDRVQEVSISLRLAGVSLILLLIAIGNVANLLIVRGMRRRREIAIRRALGVSTARLCRLLITESLLLSTLGAAAALIAGTWGAMALRSLLLPNIHWSSDAHLPSVIAFTATASVIVGLLAGTAPAFLASGLDVTSALKGGAGSAGQRRMWTRSLLMIGQAALSVVLLVGAGLFVQSLRNVRAIDLGFDADGLVDVQASYLNRARSREIGSALERIAADLSRVPGVRSVAMGDAPMQGFGATNRIYVPNRDSTPNIGGMPPIDVLVSAGYFNTIGVRLVAGRDFTPTDRSGAAPVAVVNKTMARVVWPGENAIGKCILTMTRSAACTTVVGVVEDVHTSSVIEPTPFMRIYLPFAQTAELDSLRFSVRGIARNVLVRTLPGTEGHVMRSALRVVRTDLPGADSLHVNDMAQVLEPKLRPWRLGATLFGALGLLAAIVAVVGMYSVITYAASCRAHEMSVRMALGARAQDVMALVAGEGLRVIFIGIAIGIAAAAAMGRLVASLLYGISAHDPVVLAGAAGLLAVMGFAAMLVPALRAGRGDPANALRAE